MNRIDLNNFYSDTFQLTRTIVVKIEAIAKRDNDVLEAAGYVVGLDKTTWRYYMNLFGEYHQTDEMMYVLSLDTNEIIPFTKESLNTHLITRRQYLTAGDLYKRLIAKYSGQSILINGILFPVDKATSIGAQNYKILRYNTDYVLWNEEQLIPDVQKWINGKAPEMFENEYHVTEDLMAHNMVMQLVSGITMALHLSRFKAIKTRFAHDFYIWSWIDSFGQFSVYKQSLTNEQTMWLHKNIEWLSNNAGKRYTLTRLIDQLLTLRNIPISQYELVLNTENQIVDLAPSPTWKRSLLNLNDNKDHTPDFYTTEQLITKELPTAPDNEDTQAIYLDDAIQKGTYSTHSNVLTKVLESEMVDSTNRHAETTMKVVLNEWIYLASQGILNYNVGVTDPKDGRVLRMDTSDAYILWRYLTRAADGINLVKIEKPYYQSVTKLTPPSLDDIKNIGLGFPRITDMIAQSIREEFVSITSITSSEELMTTALSVYKAKWNLTKLYSQYSDMMQRACVKNATKFMFQTGCCSLTDENSYDTFLSQYALDFTEYTSSELSNFAWVIFKAVTGWDLNTNPSVRSIQSDLIDIMMKLSSYTIHTVKTMDDGTDVTEWPYDNMIGDSGYLGFGHQLIGDFKNVEFSQRWDPRLYAKETIDVVLPQSDKLTVISNATIKARFNDTNNFRLLPIKPGNPKNILKIPNSDYLDVTISVSPTDTLTLPGTYYGNLGDKLYTLVIPPTYYGELG